jgi:hypothetical protein
MSCHAMDPVSVHNKRLRTDQGRACLFPTPWIHRPSRSTFPFRHRRLLASSPFHSRGCACVECCVMRFPHWFQWSREWLPCPCGVLLCRPGVVNKKGLVSHAGRAKKIPYKFQQHQEEEPTLPRNKQHQFVSWLDASCIMYNASQLDPTAPPQVPA